MPLGAVKTVAVSAANKKGSVNIIASLRLQFRLGQAIDWHISQKFNKENWMRRLPY